jgi:5-methylcytosine-specific restriction endonuclease McrA
MPAGALNAAKTHCPRGHHYTSENVYVLPSRPNARYCRACRRDEKRRAKNLIRHGDADWSPAPPPTPEERKARVAAWKRANAHRVREANARRSARKRKAGTFLLTPKDQQRLAGPCLYCGSPGGTIDHVVPIARGGTHGIGNLVPCCLPCNMSKHKSTVMEWRRRTNRPGGY